MVVKSYKDLNVWQKAINLADEIYNATEKFPKNEIYGLACQMQRSAVSIASNIAEGSARNGTKEFIQFIAIAKGSLAELETQMIIAYRRNYMSKDIYDNLEIICTEIGKMLTRLNQSLATNH
ncbi:MAG: four helix bundle protein [Pseudomonadota bacterium]